MDKIESLCDSCEFCHDFAEYGWDDIVRECTVQGMKIFGIITQCEFWKESSRLGDDGVNEMQKAVLEIIRLNYFNNFNGKQIAKWLSDNEDKYTAFCVEGKSRLILRDLKQHNFYNASYLYIATDTLENAAIIRSVGKYQWRASTAEIASRWTKGWHWDNKLVVMLWWD